MKRQNSDATRLPSRPFIFFAIVMIMTLLMGLEILTLFFSTPQPSPAALTETADSGSPMPLNATQLAQVTQTAESAILTAQAMLDATSHQQE